MAVPVPERASSPIKHSQEEESDRGATSSSRNSHERFLFEISCTFGFYESNSSQIIYITSLSSLRDWFHCLWLAPDLPFDFAQGRLGYIMSPLRGWGVVGSSTIVLRRQKAGSSSLRSSE
jgi:hypothetical protein